MISSIPAIINLLAILNASRLLGEQTDSPIKFTFGHFFASNELFPQFNASNTEQLLRAYHLKEKTTLSATLKTLIAGEGHFSDLNGNSKQTKMATIFITNDDEIYNPDFEALYNTLRE